MSSSGQSDPFAMLDVRTREASTSDSASPATSGISSVPGSGSSTPPVRREEERRRQLRKMKRRATGMLVAMTVFFLLLTILTDARGVWAYLQALAEASMVGALADWFAVTALFRHPMRLPIPHTAVIPRKKDQIGTSLGTFVQENFLTRGVVEERLDGVDVPGRLGAFLAAPGRAERLAGDASAAL